MSWHVKYKATVDYIKITVEMNSEKKSVEASEMKEKQAAFPTLRT